MGIKDITMGCIRPTEPYHSAPGATCESPSESEHCMWPALYWLHVLHGECWAGLVHVAVSVCGAHCWHCQCAPGWSGAHATHSAGLNWPHALDSVCGAVCGADLVHGAVPV